MSRPSLPSALRAPLLALVVLACAAARPPEDPAVAFRASEAARAEPVDAACPYTNVFVHWPESLGERGVGFSPVDLELGRRVALAYSQELEQHGFHRVAVEDAYWVAYSQSMLSRRSPDAFIALFNTRATHKLRSGALVLGPLLGDSVGETKSFYISTEWSAVDPEAPARHAATATARALQPHTRRMCEDWHNGRRQEEAQLERLRQELSGEIERIQRQRARRLGTKHLEVQVEAPAPP